MICVMIRVMSSVESSMIEKECQDWLKNELMMVNVRLMIIERRRP